MKELITKLIEKRAHAWEAYKAFLDSVSTEDRDLSGEERQKDERYRADLDALDLRINELTRQHEANEKADEHRSRVEAITGRNVDDPAKPDADPFRRLARGELRSIDVPLSFAVDHARDGSYQIRALSVGTAGAGGTLVPASFRQQLYEALLEDAAIRQTNVTVLQTAGGGNLSIPYIASVGTAAIVGEGTALAGSDPSFATVVLGSWKYGQLVSLSREVIEDSGIDLLGWLARDIGRGIGAASGAALVTGSGTNAPKGVMTACGTGVSGGTGVVGVPTADNLIDLFYSVNAKYRAKGFWFMRDATLGKIRKIKDSDNQYLWQPGLTIGAPETLLGRPIVADPNVAATGTSAKSVAFGDFSGYFIRDVGVVEVSRSDDYAFNTDQVTFRGVLRTDGDLIDANAIKAFVGGTA